MINVISVDDHEMISLGLEKIFEETADIRLVQHFKTSESLLKYIESQKNQLPENTVVMLDLKLEEKDSLECADTLLSYGINVFIYSSYSNSGYVIRTMEHKIRGYVTKNADKSEIIQAVHAVSKGETYIQKDLLPDTMFLSSILVTLTQKERNMVDLISEHLSNEEIASRMNLSKRTVENYISRIFDKFNVNNRYELEKMI